jgi:gas vesicle protein
MEVMAVPDRINRFNVMVCFPFVVAGGLAGALFALLYAPAAGEQTRETIRMQREIAIVKISRLINRAKKNMPGAIGRIIKAEQKGHL